jgi:hypothetical protein
VFSVPDKKLKQVATHGTDQDPTIDCDLLDMIGRCVRELTVLTSLQAMEQSCRAGVVQSEQYQLAILSVKTQVPNSETSSQSMSGDSA